MPHFVLIMDKKFKNAIAVIREDKILLECPFCGKTLIRTDHVKIRKLLDYEGMPRGKVCPKCEGIAVLKLNSQTKEAIRAKIAASAPPKEYDPTEEIVQPTEQIVQPTEKIVEPTEQIVESTEKIVDPTEQIVESTEKIEAP